MKIRRYTIINVFYNEDEQGVADKKRKQLEKQGYELNNQDSGEPFDYCDEYIKYFGEKNKKIFPPHACEYVDTGKKLKCKICGESIGQWFQKEIKKGKKNKKQHEQSKSK